MASLRLALILALLWNLIPFSQAWAALSHSRGGAVGRAAIARAGLALPRWHGHAPVLTPGLGQAPTPGRLAAGAALPTLPLGEESGSRGPAAKPAFAVSPGPRLARGLESLAQGMEERRDVSRSPAAAPAALLDAAFDNAAGRAPTDLGGGISTPYGGGGGLSPDSGSGRGSGSQDVPPPVPQGPAPRGSRVWLSFIPNMITGLNLASGMAAALLASQGLFLHAAGLIILANVFDMLDGRVARLLKIASPMGLQLDSLADVVSFGIAPAILVFQAALASWGWYGFAVAAAFAFAGAYRLARFNLIAQGLLDPGPTRPDSFLGLPIPGGAGVLVGLALALGLIPSGLQAPVAAAVTLLAAAAMVSRLPYPAFKKGGLKALLLPASVAVAAGIALAFLGQPFLIPAVVFGLYLLAGPLIRLCAGASPAFKFEVGRKVFHQLTLLYLLAYHLIPYPVFLPLLAAWTALFGLGEYLRIRTAWGKRALSWIGLSGILREKEGDRPSGAFFVSLGVLLTAGLFGYEPVLVAAGILALSLGDAVSALVGRRFGWRPYTVMGTRRSLDGTLAGLLTAFLIALALGLPPLAALAAAAAFSVVDTIPLRPDDNLWIPVVFAAALFFSSLAPYILGVSLLTLGWALWRPITGSGPFGPASPDVRL